MQASFSQDPVTKIFCSSNIAYVIDFIMYINMHQQIKETARRCLCFPFNEDALEEAYEEGIRTFEDLQNRYAIGLGCGSCIEDIQDIWNKFILSKSPSK